MNLTEFTAASPAERFRAFVEWLGTQNPLIKFDYVDNYNCALAQFAKSFTPDENKDDVFVNDRSVRFGDYSKSWHEVLNRDQSNRLAGCDENFGAAYKALSPLVE